MTITKINITGKEYNKNKLRIYVMFSKTKLNNGLHKMENCYEFYKTYNNWDFKGYIIYDDICKMLRENHRINKKDQSYVYCVEIPNDAQLCVYTDKCYGTHIYTDSVNVTEGEHINYYEMKNKSNWLYSRHYKDVNYWNILMYIIFPNLILYCVHVYDRCIKILKIHPDLIFIIPDKLRTSVMYDILINSIDTNIENIKYLSKIHKTKEICDKIIKYIESENKYDLIQYIPGEYLSQDMCNMIFEKDHHNIQYVPNKFITRDMCNKLLNINKWYYEKYLTNRKI